MVELRLPGPMELPPQVIRYLSKKSWLINHRGTEFKTLLGEVTANLKKIFQTKNNVFLFPGSGTLGMEAAVVSLCGIDESQLLSPLFISNGYFGDIFIQIAEGYGVIHDKVKFPIDKPISVSGLEKEISTFGSNYYGVLFFVHNESSNGLTNNAAEIVRVARAHNSNIIVVMDAISSMGGINIPVDEWGVDVVITASQKALMAPPGVAIMSVSERTTERINKVKRRGFYGDIKRYWDYFEKDQTPTTPCLPVIGALGVATSLILEEGLENVFERHKKVALCIKSGLAKLGFEVLGDTQTSSLTITAAYLPDNLKQKCTSQQFVELLKQKEKIEIAAGAHGKGDYIRIGHMGYIDEADARRIVRAIKNTADCLKTQTA